MICVFLMNAVWMFHIIAIGSAHRTRSVIIFIATLKKPTGSRRGQMLPSKTVAHGVGVGHWKETRSSPETTQVMMIPSMSLLAMSTLPSKQLMAFMRRHIDILAQPLIRTDKRAQAYSS